jgi:hypothetical protein
MRPSPDHSTSGYHHDHELDARISGEFREMPGLTLTLAQASRLFSLDSAQCARVLGSLVERGLLWTNGRAFGRLDTGRRCV